MNYKCKRCGSTFDEPHTYYESHGFTDGMYEQCSCCPNCGGDYTDNFDDDDVEVDE